MKNEIIPKFVEGRFQEESKSLTSSKEWIGFRKASRSLSRAAFDIGLPFDPRFNAVHWAFDVEQLCNEIGYSYCWMKSYAEFYKQRFSNSSRPGHVDFYVSYFADNCITRIDSCRDKLALMVWAFYVLFNPEKKDEVLDYPRILERLMYPIKFGMEFRNQSVFLYYLRMLKGKDFARMERYRHLKVHRREPRIEIYGVRPHHDWSYMVPLLLKKDIAKWKKELEDEYTDPTRLEFIMQNCQLGDVYFDHRKLEDRVWDFGEIEELINNSLNKLLQAVEGCFRVLRRRSPLRKTRRN